MTIGGVLAGVAVFVLLKWRLHASRRRVYIVNHDDYFYTLHIWVDGAEEQVTLPCQYLHWAIALFEKCSSKHPVELNFVSNAGPEHDDHLTIPPWAHQGLLRELKKQRRKWQPRWPWNTPAGPYR